MNSDDILKYGHLTVLAALEGLPESDWEMDGVCGIWSVRQIVAHLASVEQLLAEILGTLLAPGPTPVLDQYLALGDDEFNARQVASRQSLSVAATQDEYVGHYEAVRQLWPSLPAPTRRRPGILAWYGEEYDLEDFLVYGYYGHKREHSAQIAVYRDRIRR